MVDFTDDAKRRYDQWLSKNKRVDSDTMRHRFLQQERYDRATATKKPEPKQEAVEPAKPKEPEFKSRFGKKLAAGLKNAADKAETARSKYDYLKSQAGRITKSVAPAKKANNGRRAKVPVQLKPYVYKKASARRQSAPVHVEREGAAIDRFGDMINGRPSGRSTSDMLDDFTFGGRGGNAKRSKSGRDFWDSVLK